MDELDVGGNSKDFDQDNTKTGITIYLDGEICVRNIIWDIHFQASILGAPHYWESERFVGQSRTTE